MKIYQNNGLNAFQNLLRTAYKAPEGSLCAWTVKNIELLDKSEVVYMEQGWGQATKRILGAVLPIFALLDALQYFGKTLFHACLLQQDATGDALCKFCHSVRLFFTSLLATPVAIASPALVYKTENAWNQLQRDRIVQRIKEKQRSLTSAGKESCQTLQCALKHARDTIVANEQARNSAGEIIDEMIKQVPWGDPKENPIVEEYIQVFANFLVVAEKFHVRLEKQDPSFLTIAKEIVKLRKPALRNGLMDTLLKDFSQRKEIFTDFGTLLKSHERALTKDKQISVFLVLHLLDEAQKPPDADTIVDQTVQLLSEDKFDDSIVNVKFIAMMLELVSNNELQSKNKVELLRRVLDTYAYDIEEKKKHLERQESARKSKPKGACEKLEETLKKKKQFYEQLKKECDTGQLTEKRNTQYVKLPDEIKDLEEKIKTFKPAKAATASTDTAGSNTYHGALYHTLKAIANVSILLALKKKKLIEKSLLAIGTEPGRPFSYISDPRLISCIFSEEFKIKGLPDDLDKKLEDMRLPGTLIAYRARLKELEAKRRNIALKTYNRYILAAFNGKLSEERHREDINAHLKFIFKDHPNLKKEWKTFHSEKLTTKKYLGYTLVDTEDPIDLMLQASEIGNCCLDMMGRLARVTGLLGIILDGKTHTIVIKDPQGVIVAKTRLVLLWDEMHKSPVLLLDQVDTQKSAEDDHTLEEAVLRFCKQRAEKLNLILITKQEKYQGDPYNGKIKSLGSSSPYEYVNALYLDYSNGVYNVGETCRVK